MSNKRSASQNFLTGAAILSLSTIIVKVIGMFYKIPLKSFIGDNGFAYFSAAYDIYSFLLVISTTGLPIAMSRMVSEAHTLGNGKQMQRIFKTALTAYLIIGLAGTGVMMLLPNILANIMGTPSASFSILALGPAVVFICIASACRGYFQGQGDMKPTAISQIIEAAGKLFLGLSFAWLVMSATSSDALASGATIAGISIGAGFSALYVYIKYRRNRKKIEAMGGKAESSRKTAKTLLAIAIPITIGAAGLQFINLLDSITVMHRLVSAVDTNYAIVGSAATVKGNTLNSEDAAICWQIEESGDGFYLSQNGSTLELSKDHSLCFGTENADTRWYITTAQGQDDSFYIYTTLSENQPVYLGYDPLGGTFYAQSMDSSAAAEDFVFHVYLPAEGGEGTAYELASDFTGTESAVLYNVRGLKALSTSVKILNPENNTGILLRISEQNPKDGMSISQNAAEIGKGIYNFCQTIFNFPTAFIPCITAAIIPTITANLTRKDKKGVKQVQDSSLRIMSLIASPCAVGLFVLAEPIMALLDGQEGDKLAIAGLLLMILAPTVLVNSISTMTTAIMQAHNHMVLPVINTLIGGVLKVIVNFILVGNPDIGILGAPIGTFVCFLVIMVLNIISMRCVLEEPPKLLPALWRSALASVIMGVITFFVYALLWKYLASYTICCLGAIAIAVAIYVLLVIALKPITYEDCLLLPKGEKIAKILRIHQKS